MLRGQRVEQRVQELSVLQSQFGLHKEMHEYSLEISEGAIFRVRPETKGCVKLKNKMKHKTYLPLYSIKPNFHDIMIVF